MPNRFATELAIDPENLRASLLTLILRVCAVLGIVVYVPSVYMLVQQRSLGIVAIDTGALLAVIGILFLDRIPFRVRAAAVCLIFYALGVGLLVSLGAISQIYLFGFSIVAVLLLGRRIGLYAAILSSVSLLAVGSLGYASPTMAVPNWRGTFTDWVVIAINFTFVNTMITLAVGALLTTLQNALEREIGHRLSLERAEAGRGRALAELELQIERMPLAYLLTDRDFRFVHWNPAAERMFGYAESEVLGKHPFDVIVPENAQALVGGLFESIKAGSMDAHGESENLTKDGRTIACEWHNTPMFDDTGEFAGLLSLAQNVTESRTLERQLRQAQKMEAVGQLAGGVAHDFNNLLSVVLSYSDLILADLKAGDALREDIEEIRHAGQRAAALTRQLLTFSRKQIIAPRVLDLNEVLSGVDKMLRRLVGEDVELTTVLGASLGRVRIDPGSLEQVIVNLAVNARDAMPVGGKLTMETANDVLDEKYAKAHLGAKPGAYVRLSVNDTGSGMDEPTLARIFEPFFTTKEQGKGTGLGLSTVFGIVQQSGGSMWVDSKPGFGTSFKLYLPCVEGAVDVDDSRAPPVATTLQGAETILLVEDEDQVREVTRDVLFRHGYHVLDARNGGEAVLLSEGHEGTIHLLLTDVVMPKMSGPVLAKRLADSRPEMKVLCMSGYTDDAAVRHGVVESEIAFLQKPMTVESLTRKVRAVLDSDGRG